MWRSDTVGHLARFISFFDSVPGGLVWALRSLIVLGLVLWVALPQVQESFDASRRYAAVGESDWEGTNNALESARCARKTGAWLLRSCENGQVVPFSAEDPGQPLLLSLWARLAGRDATVMDAARLNLGINVLCLAILIGALISLGAFVTSVVLLLLGPVIFLFYFGTSPHWSLMGAASIQIILPLALIARAKGWLQPAASGALIAIGVASLALVALLRESVGTMALLMTICAAAWTMRYGRRGGRHLATTVAILLVAVVASQSSRLIVAARDWAYSLDAAHLPATHGMSHTLYIGLGGVPNKFGIEYDDAVGRAAASAAVPGIVHYSKDYFRVMRELYIRKWQEDPREMIRIYFEKLKLMFTDHIFGAGHPALGTMLALFVAIQLVTGYRHWTAGDRGSDTRLAINVVALGFVGLFVVQGVLATPTRLYSLPLGPFVLVLAGIAIENLGAWVWSLATRSIPRPP